MQNDEGNKITALRKVHHADLSALYENPIEHACNVNEGDTYVSADGLMSEGFCPNVRQSVQPFVMTPAHGGKSFYGGWMKNPEPALISCNDGFRPVSFLLETIDE